MNTRMLLVGGLLGFLLTLGLLFSGGLTGFTIFGGPNAINIREVITEPTIIPLTTPSTLSQLTLTGRYSGSGEVTVRLVSNTTEAIVAQYSAPEITSENTLLLQEEGVVEPLQPGQTITFTHVFEESCEETCEGTFTGPFTLDVEVTGGNLTLSSVQFTTPEEQAPNESVEEPVANDTFVADEPKVSDSKFLSPECTNDNMCSQGQYCYQQYCLATSGQFNITNQDGNPVAIFDRFGKLLLKGDVHENSTEEAPDDAFRIQDEGNNIAWITQEGDLYVRGEIFTELQDLPQTSGDEWVLENEDEIVCLFDGETGNFYSVDSIGEHVSLQ